MGQGLSMVLWRELGTITMTTRNKDKPISLRTLRAIVGLSLFNLAICSQDTAGPSGTGHANDRPIWGTSLYMFKRQSPRAHSSHGRLSEQNYMQGNSICTVCPPNTRGMPKHIGSLILIDAALREIAYGQGLDIYSLKFKDRRG